MSRKKNTIGKPSFIKPFFVSLIISLFVVATIGSLLLYIATKYLADRESEIVERSFKESSSMMITGVYDKGRLNDHRYSVTSFLYDGYGIDYEVCIDHETLADSSLMGYMKYGDIGLELREDCLGYFKAPEVEKYKGQDGICFLCSEFYFDKENCVFIPKKAIVYRNTANGKELGPEIEIVPEDIHGFISEKLDQPCKGYIVGNSGILASIDHYEDEVFWGKIADEYGEYYCERTFEYGMSDTNFMLVILQSNKINYIVACVIIVIISLVIAFIFAITIYNSNKTKFEIFEYRRKTTDAMAHDLKTPLASIGGYAENLANNIGGDKQEYYASMIIDKVSQMNRSINDILALSRSENDQLKVNKTAVDINGLINEVVEDNEQMIAQKELQIKFQGSDKLVLNTDRELMKQALGNIINNAVKYSRQGASIDIVSNPTEIRITNIMNESVNSVDDLKEAFTKGSASRSEHGSGLGLTIADNDLKMLKYKLVLKTEGDRFICSIRL